MQYFQNLIDLNEYLIKHTLEKLQPLGAAPELRVLTSPPGGSDAHQVGGLLVWPRPHSLRARLLLEKSRK